MNVGFAFDAYTVKCVKDGVLPFWDPYQGLGHPFLGNGLSAVFYPVNWLHFLLPPGWWDMVFLVNWLLAAVFLFAYLALMNIPRRAAIFGAVALFGCGSFEILLSLREVVGVVAWFPLLLYGVERALRQPGWRGRHIVLALAVFCSITAGQPEVALITFLTAGLYIVCRTLGILRSDGARTALRSSLGLAPGLVIGALLSAPHWLIFLNYSLTAYSRVVNGRVAGEHHLSLIRLPAYFFPYFFGRLHTEPYGPLAGFDWNSTPGWTPPLVFFLAIGSIGLLRKRREFGQKFLFAAVLVSLGKIYGVPGLSQLGHLPLLRFVFFPKYAACIPDLCLAGLAAFGIYFLSGASSRYWNRLTAAWTLLVLSLFFIGTLSIWKPLAAAPRGSVPNHVFIVFGLGGLAWALVQPFGLWLIARWRRERSAGLYVVGGLGVLLHGVAFAPAGYSVKTWGVLFAIGLLIYAASAVITALRARFPDKARIAIPKVFLFARVIPPRSGEIGAAAGAIVLVALFGASTSFFSPHGLAYRWDPLAAPPYIERLRALQENRLYRSYSLDSDPQPAFASPFQFESLDYSDALCPMGAAKYMSTYLDAGAVVLYFAGDRGFRAAGSSAASEFRRNHRYFNLAAVKYLVTQGSDPNVSAPPIPVTTAGKRAQPDHSLNLDSDGSSDKFKDPVPRESEDLRMVYKDASSGATIWENLQAGPRVFLAPEYKIAASEDEALSHLSQLANLHHTVWIEGGELSDGGSQTSEKTGVVRRFEVRPNEVFVDYHAEGPGILTLTDAYSEGWRVEIDGKQTQVVRVDGVFRGVRIKSAGDSKIRFWYRPPGWTLSLILCGLGVAWLALLYTVWPVQRAAGKGVPQVLP